jgi:hypothetical protein
VIFRVSASVLVEADDANEAYAVASDHFAKLSRGEWSDLVLPESRSTVDPAEEPEHVEDVG